jgi:hypothetical protein
MPRSFRLHPWSAGCLLAAAFLCLPEGSGAQTCARNLTADVVAIDQVFFWNRLGAVQPQGQMFALRRDVEPITRDREIIEPPPGGTVLLPGGVRLRPDKRPRPLVLRMNVGDCLTINFQNLLANTPRDDEQAATRYASIHAIGMELQGSIQDDGSYVGKNPSSLVPPGGSAVYTLYADREGEHVITSQGTTTGGEGDGGQINAGLFGALIVEPKGSTWYRSQVTRLDLQAASSGNNAKGLPIVNYAAVYPVGHPWAGLPVLKMLLGNEIVHSDLTAIIAGPGEGGSFSTNLYPPNGNSNPNRHEPFREFAIIYHDETGAVQAFPHFEDPVLQHTLHSVRDAFAINYGSGGTGAEVLANRFGVGPMHACVDCKYEEFFLSSWAAGDPAMIVDVPANSPCTMANVRSGNIASCTPAPGAKASKAFYPDDPSNVYHSYLRDHTKFRVLHAGSKEHHIHHLHAHQWLYAPDDDQSSYLDSQAIGPGNSFTAEIAHEGGGNANLTPGDSIFHCHFYPHFAQGMWSLWRVHDVFEAGTELDGSGRPTSTARALPDGEIAAGTPIPAIVPLPGQPMAPIPGAKVTIAAGQVEVDGTGNPGYPFFVPATAGHRPPGPPLDLLRDGGLARHKIVGGAAVEAHTRTDFHKTLTRAVAKRLPHLGTTVEQQAMAFHALRSHATCLPDGTCGSTIRFVTNGLPAVAGAPFADPCVDDAGNPVGNPRLYKAADIQDDVTFNKAGWHFFQQRFTALQEDVNDFLGLNGSSPKRPPEPLFFRANSRDCIEYQFTNLVPHEYLSDDFQVRTPTDVLGQHIHLVKFDVLASDGAANGFNYEDGSLSPGEVRERIEAIRAENGCTANDSRNGLFDCPQPEIHPFFGSGPDQDGDGEGDWIGAQTTIQRWYADPVLDNQGKDRTLRTVFTHDHFGPSTHQQTGLYAGLVIEPEGSAWAHSETGVPFYTRNDGGPTSWQALIDPEQGPDHREFLLLFSDFQPAYDKRATTFPNVNRSINPPAKEEVALSSTNNDLLQRAVRCPGNALRPCPEAISSADVGTLVVNYRNEPLALRVRDPLTNAQAAGTAGDLSYAFSSNVTRADAAFNTQPSFYAPLTIEVNETDPYTPLLRTYENDRVQIRVLVGGHEEGHNFSIHGLKWLQEPSNSRSGYRGSQMMGISEHFEFIVPRRVQSSTGPYVDRLWSAGSSVDDYWNGIWGLLRTYPGKRPDLAPLPDNLDPQNLPPPGGGTTWDYSCPPGAPVRPFDVTAVQARKSLAPSFRLDYNLRTDGSFGPIYDNRGLVYLRTSDLDTSVNPPRLKPGVVVEPLVLRARAGECIELTLNNALGGGLIDFDGYNTLPMIVDLFNANDLEPSGDVGLHPQMLFYDVSRFDGANVGGNAFQTVPPGGAPVTYRWYAGDVKIDSAGNIVATPIEFGAVNLISSDRIKHASKGLFGALIIEPADATWAPNSRSVATVTSASVPGGSFRELVLQVQTDANLQMDVNGSSQEIKNLAGMEDPEDSGQKAVNYRTEPLWKRMQHAPETPLTATRGLTDWWNVTSNTKVGGNPETPVFTVQVGAQVRLRLLQAGGHGRNGVFALHGHQWDKQPYLANSTRLGQNSVSLWEGAHFGLGPTSHFDVLLRGGAGGSFGVPGDYLFRDFVGPYFDGGLWGILRVVP